MNSTIRAKIYSPSLLNNKQVWDQLASFKLRITDAQLEEIALLSYRQSINFRHFIRGAVPCGCRSLGWNW